MPKDLHPESHLPEYARQKKAEFRINSQRKLKFEKFQEAYRRKWNRRIRNMNYRFI